MRKTYEELNAIKKQYKVDTLWSFSRYNTYKTSHYEYFLKYVLHKKEDREDSIYSVVGGLGHDILEKLYTNQIQFEDMNNLFEDAWMTAQIAELKFDRCDNEKNKKISDKYYANLKHFFYNHQMLPYKLQTEQFLLIKIGNLIFNGYLDGCYKDENGNYTILDFKTSTIYKGEKAIKEATQLFLYSIGLHQLGVPYEKIKICWNFLKYVSVSCEQANGKINVREIERSEIGSSLQSSVKMWLKKLKYSEDDILFYLDILAQTNSIIALPEDIKSKFEIHDCYIYVDVTEEIIQDLTKNIIDTVYEIVQKENEYHTTNDDLIWWDDPESVKKQSYYFANLSGYSANLLKPYKQYLENLDAQKNGSIFGVIKENTDDDLSWLNEL